MRQTICAWAMLFALAPPAAAETVEVKYLGAVDLSGFDCSDTVSSFVHRVCYSGDETKVIVLLKSVYYAYCEVPADLVSAWLEADSKGRFYNSGIKGQYACAM